MSQTFKAYVFCFFSLFAFLGTIVFSYFFTGSYVEMLNRLIDLPLLNFIIVIALQTLVFAVIVCLLVFWWEE